MFSNTSIAVATLNDIPSLLTLLNSAYRGESSKHYYLPQKNMQNIIAAIQYMKVISLRTELIDWYKRHGYHNTGKRKEFNEDPLTGKHLQSLEFMVLEKKL